MNRLPRQLTPLLVIFVVAIGSLFVARHLLVPRTFGEYGHYRAAAVGEIAGQEFTYAGSLACADCHSDVYDLKQNSFHAGVACEVCHGPAKRHVDAPDEFVPEKPKGRGFCPLCHGYNPSRPSGFPQILPDVHNAGKACMTCHEPHNPTLPHPPEECSACHREIASKKMVSRHTNVACTVCHTVPPEHYQNPRLALAKKPLSKAVCGQCHASDASSSREIPRVDMTAHGGRYQCWDCHYPHYPEAIQ
ncbi:MAG: hypothetical protein AB1644_07615 [Candidatus Zixiibacteriota bacterium]